MKTNTKTISFQEDGLQLQDGRQLLIKIFNDQIQAQKEQFLSAWLKDHTTSSNERDRKVEELKDLKEELRAFLDQAKGLNADLSFKVNIEVQLHNKVSQLSSEEVFTSAITNGRHVEQANSMELCKTH